MRLLFVLGARSEWGYIKPIIDLAKTRGYNCEIWACNMSVLGRFGSLVDEISAEGYKIIGKFNTSVDGDNRVSMAKSLGVAVLSASDWLANNDPDWIVVAGDRMEQLAVTLSAAILYKPIAHIQAGERSGNIDGVTRHAIARFAHIHFAANEDARERLLKSGEQQERIFLTGAPQLDEITLTKIPNKEELIERGIISQGNFILGVLHGTTEEDGHFLGNVSNLVEELSEVDAGVVWIASNNDSDKQTIERVVKDSLRANDKFFTNLNRVDYLGLLKNCKFIIGNSSSGILEAPSFKTPAINLGRRQDLRYRGQNVIDASFSKEEIKASINKALSPTFLRQLEDTLNPYGDGQSSQRILDVLENTTVNPEFLIKQITY
jgi:GDP/UDP-N,N'-diacetylbacillosamine 2-epimerase (hydrolysing)